MDKNKLPKTLQPYADIIAEFSDERAYGDGYWVVLKPGLWLKSNPKCSTAHAHTLKALAVELKIGTYPMTSLKK